MTQYLALCALSFLASHLLGGTIPCSMYSIIGILQSLYGSGSKGAGSSGGSFCSAAAANALASTAVHQVTQVKLQVAGGSVSTCFVARLILGFSIPTMGIILFTKGSEVDTRAAKGVCRGVLSSRDPD